MMQTAFHYDSTPRFVHSAYQFTGKERDAESGYDYFGARYYSSSVGRFMSPDWSVKIEPVPYAKLGNPQSLNLFSYVLNNPIALADPDGHELPGGDAYNSMAGQALWAYLTGGNQIAAMQNLAQQQSSTSTSTTNINSRAQAQYNNDVPIIAKQLGVSTDEVLDSVHIDYDANGRAVVIGGHVNMTVDDGSDAQAALAARLGPGPHGYNENPATGEGQGSEFSRLGTTPSVHLDNGLVHVDRFNAGAWGGLGVVPHFFYDVVYGGMHGSTALLPY
jgi:RHS repeat-associated protein